MNDDYQIQGYCLNEFDLESMLMDVFGEDFWINNAIHDSDRGFTYLAFGDNGEDTYQKYQKLKEAAIKKGWDWIKKWDFTAILEVVEMEEYFDSDNEEDEMLDKDMEED